MANPLNLGHGRAVDAVAGAQVDLVEVRLARNGNVALRGMGAGTKLSASRLLIDGTLPLSASGLTGWAVGLYSGAHLSMDEARLSGNVQTAMLIDGKSTRAAIARLVIDGTLPAAGDGTAGIGMAVEDGAWLQLDSARLTANRHTALSVNGQGRSGGHWRRHGGRCHRVDG